MMTRQDFRKGDDVNIIIFLIDSRVTSASLFDVSYTFNNLFRRLTTAESPITMGLSCLCSLLGNIYFVIL